MGRTQVPADGASNDWFRKAYTSVMLKFENVSSEFISFNNFHGI